MHVAVLVARIVLAAIFGTAAITKLADVRGTRSAVEDFGVPAPLVRPSALMLPWVELAATVLLLVPATAWWGGLASLLLLAVFSVAVGVNLGRGRTPDCHCFGKLTPSPVGAAVLVRNLAFAIPALLVVLFA